MFVWYVASAVRKKESTKECQLAINKGVCFCVGCGF